jgi:phosphoglucomutase
MEKFEPDASRQGDDAQIALKDFRSIAEEVAEIRKYTGMEKPTVIT